MIHFFSLESGDAERKHCPEWYDTHTKAHWASPAKSYSVWVWQYQKSAVFFSKPKTACQHSNLVSPSVPHKENKQTKKDVQR